MLNQLRVGMNLCPPRATTRKLKRSKVLTLQLRSHLPALKAAFKQKTLVVMTTEAYLHCSKLNWTYYCQQKKPLNCRKLHQVLISRILELSDKKKKIHVRNVLWNLIFSRLSKIIVSFGRVFRHVRLNKVTSKNFMYNKLSRCKEIVD